MTQPWQRVYGAPICIGLASILGLLAALLVEPAGRYVSWIAVGLPIGIVLWRAAKSVKPKQATTRRRELH